jgi:hypothetical protein
MQLPSAGFCALIIHQHPKNQSVVYQSGLAASTAPAKPAGWPRLNAGALPPGVMVFALLDDFVNLTNLHIKHDGKNPCHREAAATCTYRRTLATSLKQISLIEFSYFTLSLSYDYQR